jgi:hypothetical protein
MIADFVIDKMSAYVAGGMRPETAATSTCGELMAIYKGDHYSRDGAGQMGKTPPPENIALEEFGGLRRMSSEDSPVAKRISISIIFDYLIKALDKNNQIRYIFINYNRFSLSEAAPKKGQPKVFPWGSCRLSFLSPTSPRIGGQLWRC